MLFRNSDHNSTFVIRNIWKAYLVDNYSVKNNEQITTSAYYDHH